MIMLLLALSWSALVLYLHLLPGKELNLDGWYIKYHMDKVAHAVMFAVLFLLWFQVFIRSSFKPSSSYYFSIFIIVIYGATLELLQGTVVVGRTSDMLDLLADIAGIPLAIIVLKVFSWDGNAK